MRILVTGAQGFVGKNLCAALRQIQCGNDRTHQDLHIEEIMEVTLDTSHQQLLDDCQRADFVFHFAGVNRPKDESEFLSGNFGFTGVLLDALKEAGNLCPVMAASSIQASLKGRYGQSGYGISKLTMENLLFDYAKDTGAAVMVYRFPNLFGKWSLPNYNSAVATFCHNIAHDLPIQVNDPSVQLELVYIDDLIEEMFCALSMKPHRCFCKGTDFIPDENGMFCFVPVSHHVTLQEITDLLYQFNDQRRTLMMPKIPAGSFAKKLYSTYLSYLPKDKVSIPLKMNTDHRGSFTELLKTQECGQFSVNVCLPSVMKGQHWHHSKWEFFMVVSGHGLIQMRKMGTNEVLEFEVSGEKMEAVHMLPGYTHNLMNLSDTENLVTLMWANECFDQKHPDTFYEEV